MSRAKGLIVRASVIGALVLAGSAANADCIFGGSGEPSLQNSFNTLLGAGAPNEVPSCVADGDDARWTTNGPVTEIDIVLELAGNAQSNTFGIYDLNNPNRRLTVFEGNDAVASTATVRLRDMGGGQWRVSVLEHNNP